SLRLSGCPLPWHFASLRCVPSVASSISFFLRTRPPPRSTLFPYTTLFRSEPEGWILYLLEPVAVKEKASPPSSSGLDLDTLIEQDRKSTRLNSSHVKISYAVFCLKKKKKKKTRNGCRQVR